MKKIVLAVLCSAALIFVSCNPVTGTGGSSSDSSGSDSSDTKKDSDSTSTTDYESMTAQEFTKVMGNGINLGNTFDSSAAIWSGYNAATSSYEQGWGQPVTNKEMMEAYKTAGFDSIRIPVAWTSTMDWVNDDYTINDDYMARIKEVVGYALDAGLIVMINDHWDYQWWGLFGNSSTQDTAYKIFDAIWDQVGTAFKDYDCRLIFEAGNEEWGDRFNDVVYDHNDTSKTQLSSGGSLTVAEQYKLITTLAQRFVDKIRAQGSKNAKRFLLIPGYGTDFDKTCSSSYVMPTDETNSVNKLLVSVHYYEPALYCIAEEPVNWGGIKQPATTWGTSSEVSTQNSKFEEMKKFIDAGYGVIIGEYAPAMLLKTYDDGTEYRIRKDNDTVWMTNVLDNCDKYNYCPFLWDCNGYFYKGSGTAPDAKTTITTYGFADSDVAAVYKNRNYASETGKSSASSDSSGTSDDSSTSGSSGASSGNSGSSGTDDSSSATAAVTTKLSDNTSTVSADGIIEYTTLATCTSGQEITVSATINGASNFQQIGFQSSADKQLWHSAWENNGFGSNYKLTQTFTSTTADSAIYFKFIFQSLIDSSTTASEITVSDVSITVK